MLSIKLVSFGFQSVSPQAVCVGSLPAIFVGLESLPASLDLITRRGTVCALNPAEDEEEAIATQGKDKERKELDSIQSLEFVT